MTDKIQLTAVLTKDHRIKVTDQDGREFDWHPDGHGWELWGKVVLEQIELDTLASPSFEQPRLHITFGIPLKHDAT